MNALESPEFITHAGRALSTGSAEINMTPLVDIGFVLLMFFMVTTVFPDEEGIEIEKPQAANARAIRHPPIVLKIDRTGALYLKGRALSPSDARRVLRALISAEPGALVLLQVDKRTATEHLIRAIDLSKASGAERVGIAADEKPDSS